MPASECPQCHMPTVNSVGQPYCAQCGWNRGETEKQARFLLRILPVLVMVFDAPLIVYIFIGHAELSVLAVLGLLAIAPAILLILVIRGKIRFGSPGAIRGDHRHGGV